MKEFLIHDLTKKGLEKFGQTIEMSYANIQKLVLKYVMKFGQNITYYLAELRGMARLEHRFKVNEKI
jgi:anaphase-promoting complex subunit 4